MNNTDIAVAVTSYDRPQYLRRCVESLERCVEKDTVDWYFFQGGECDQYTGEQKLSPEVVEENLEILRDADLPNKEIVYDGYDGGLYVERDEMFRLYDEGYDLLFALEDDIVVGKYFLRLFKLLMSQFPECVGSMYVPRNIDECSLPGELNEVLVRDDAYWFTLGMHHETFEQIRDDWRGLRAIFCENDFEWVANSVEGVERLFENQIPPVNPEGNWPIDGTFSKLLRKYNVPRVKPAVSRTSNIGRKGQSMDPEFYESIEFLGQEGPLEYDRDATIDEWTIKSVETNSLDQLADFSNFCHG